MIVVFPILKSDYKLHFFGQSRIVYNQNSTYNLEEPETDILAYCNGAHSTSDIISKIALRYSVTEDEGSKIVRKYLEICVDKGILEIRSTKSESSVFSGVREWHYPQPIVLELTDWCNLNCVHCYLSCVDVGNSIDLKLYVR